MMGKPSHHAVVQAKMVPQNPSKVNPVDHCYGTNSDIVACGLPRYGERRIETNAWSDPRHIDQKDCTFEQNRTNARFLLCGRPE